MKCSVFEEGQTYRSEGTNRLNLLGGRRLVQRREDYSTSRVCDVWHNQDGQVEGSKRPVGYAKVGASRLCKFGSSKLS
jgi:hypothetical protein